MKTVAFLMIALASGPAQSRDDSILELGRLHTKRFLAGEIDSIWDNLSTEMKALFADQAKLEAFHTQASAQLGPEQQVIEEKTSERSGARIYSRISRFEKPKQAILTRWAFDADGAVIQFSIQPVPKEAETQHLDYTTQAHLSLPFEGTWFVFWGGRTLAENYHAATVDQRFAYDIVMRKGGVTHQGDGKRNEDYYCFRKPILAPAAGRVVAVGDGVPENVPGEMNAKQPLGNHVIIDHGHQEFSFLAHLVEESLAVQVGDSVAAGDLLGLCGNTGNSSEPHLHYHLQNSPTFGRGEGLPAQFQNYEADGQRVERGEPLKGQSIQPQR